MRFLGLFLFCVFPLACLGQQQLTVDPCGAPHKEIGQATAIFSRGKTHSQVAVQTNPLRLVGDTTEGLFLSPNFIILSRKVVAPPAVEFEIISYSAERKFASDRRFKILSHDRAVYSQTLTLATSGRSNEGTMTEVLVAKIPYRTFVSLLSESSLMLVLGDTRIEITEGNIEALRDLKRMVDAHVSF